MPEIFRRNRPYDSTGRLRQLDGVIATPRIDDHELKGMVCLLTSNRLESGAEAGARVSSGDQDARLRALPMALAH